MDNAFEPFDTLSSYISFKTDIFKEIEKVITENNFYVDKTLFIKEWWENKDDVTLIARPRRFGKTLTLDMTEKFFSINYVGRGDLFEGLAIWQFEEYQKLQGKETLRSGRA